MFSDIASAIIIGLVLGSMYALAAVGLTLVWGVLKILNFAHGGFITLGAYFVWVGITFLGGNYVISFLLVMGLTFLLGFVLNAGVIRPLQGRPESETNIFIATLATSIIIENLIIVGFGGRYKSIPEMASGSLTLGSISINFQQMIIMAVAPVFLVGLMYYLKKMKSGMAVRAVAQDADGAAIVGIDSERVYSYTIAIGALMAGVAGVLLGVIFYLSPGMGGDPLVRALFIMVLGGMGSVKGTIYGAYIIGIIDALARYFIGMFWASPILFVMFILLLLLRPQGLFGVKV
ncbi:MAG: branched-chain amino acid ABC transporter permease [Candidatus Bathyarchaeota archaeon]|nr:branched-chain amino acid ABC transporter permease [Candidatus Bathyarchaeota archaeon]